MYSETSDPRASDLNPNLRSQWVTTILVPTSSGSYFFILGISADLFLCFGFSFVCLFSTWLFMSGRSPGEGNGNPLQHSCLGNPMDKGSWQATSMGLQRVGHYLVTKQQQFIFKKLKCSQRVLAGLTEAV